MTKIELDKNQKENIIERIQSYFRDELDQDIGDFDAEFLLDFFADKVGPYFYNQGLYDAQAVFQQRLDSINEAIYDIEKPTEI